MAKASNNLRRRGFTVKDLAVTLTCLLIAAGMLASLTGATRNLSQTQVCANHLRQMYAGMAAYVEQYNSYPPNNPYPRYGSIETINGLSAGGFDPNIGFIMTHGLGLVAPRTDTATGHFIWYGTPYADLPDVCKCPAMPPSLLDPSNPEVDPGALENILYHYVVSYMTAGTCRAATPVIRPHSGAITGQGGRNPPIPDPTTAQQSAQPYDNVQGGPPYVWVTKHPDGAAPDENSEGPQYACWIQAINPAEVQSPGRVFYLADSRDYRPEPGQWQGGAGRFDVRPGGEILTSARHFGYGNVLYLDGRVTRDKQMHLPQWNMDYASTGQATSKQWRAAMFDTSVRIAGINRQAQIMPVLMVRGWEYFFGATGMKAR